MRRSHTTTAALPMTCFRLPSTARKHHRLRLLPSFTYVRPFGSRTIQDDDDEKLGEVLTFHQLMTYFEMGTPSLRCRLSSRRRERGEELDNDSDDEEEDGVEEQELLEATEDWGTSEGRIQSLFGIACGKRKVKPREYSDFRGDQPRRRKDLALMGIMVLREFQQSIERDKHHVNTENENPQEPSLHDIFYLDKEKIFGGRGRASTANKELEDEGEPTTGKCRDQDRNDNLLLAVCIRERRELMWLCENDDRYEMDPPLHTRFVGSLSGPERQLAALHRAMASSPASLTAMAMNRKKASLVNVRYIKNKLVDDVLDLDCDVVSKLNKSQKKAIAAVANPKCNRNFVIVQGPPGCGKTTTLVGMILTLCRQGKSAIVTAPSNAAVANIALKLHKTGQFEPGDLCVYGLRADKSVHFLSPQHRRKYFHGFHKKYEKMESMEEKEELLSEFCDWMGYPLHGELNDMDVLKEQCLGDVGELLQQSKIVMCTLNTAGAPWLRHNIPPGADTFFVDEGAQCPEADFFIATTFPGISKIVIVGDPQQLPATVIDPSVQKAGFGVSLMSRIYDSHPDRVHLLDTQYRMDPKILEFSNQTFYGNRIQTDKNVLNRKRIIEKPFLFVPCEGSEKQVQKSWKNEVEAALIEEILHSDGDIQSLLACRPEARIMVITPYRAQQKKLRAKLKSRDIDAATVDIATVDSFQGQEADVVILSTVRTESTGFTDDFQRLNVALTRAKFVLRVVGNHAFFQSLCEESSTLRKLAQFAHSNGLLLGQNAQDAESFITNEDQSVSDVTTSGNEKRCRHCGGADHVRYTSKRCARHEELMAVSRASKAATLLKEHPTGASATS